MYLKVMGRTSGSHTTIEIVEATFHRLPTPRVFFKRKADGEQEELALASDAFLMDGNGRTVDRFRISNGLS